MSGLFALIPAKDPVFGKSRLANFLQEAERIEFNRALVRRTLQCCVAVFGAARTVLVTPADSLVAEGGPMGVEVVREPLGTGLNGALVMAAARARALGAEGAFIVPTDIAHISEQSLRRALLTLPAAPGCLVVGSRRRDGTNLLGLRPLDDKVFAFGEHSLVRHVARAEQLAYTVLEHFDPALALDIDYPEDYRMLMEELPWLSP